VVRKLKVWQKLGIIGLAFLIPLGVTTYFLVDEQNYKIDFAQNELDGVETISEGEDDTAWLRVVESRPLEALQPVASPGLPRPAPLAKAPGWLSPTPGAIRRRAPLLGEHTDEIMGSLGYGRDAVAELRRMAPGVRDSHTGTFARGAGRGRPG